jgi:hypothetical protein
VSEQGDLVCDQILYQLEERAVEHAVIPCAREAPAGGGGVQPVWSWKLPKFAFEGRPAFSSRSPNSWVRPSPGRTSVSRAPPWTVCDPKPLLQNMPKKMLALLIVNCRKPTSSRSIKPFRSVRARNNCPCFRPHRQTKYATNARIGARERRVQRTQKFSQSGSAAKNTSSDEFASGNERSIPSWASSAPITERSFPVRSWKYSWYRRDG